MNIAKSKIEKLTRAILLLSILGTFSFLYLPMIKNWFFSDDIQWIWSSATHQFSEMFFVPERYRSMASNFTPMLGVSFRIDWLLFRMNPAGYSVHSLLSLVATSIVFFFFLRLYVQKNLAIFGVLLFLLNPITLAVTSWFSTRHYIEGLFWALLALYFFVLAERREKISWFAGLCYLFSSLNKEIYVVLPAVAFLLSKGTLLKRLKYTATLWLGLAIYTVWRLWMMGGVGGFASNQPFSFGAALQLPYKIVKFFSLQWFGEYYILLYLFLVIALLPSLKHMRMLLIFLMFSIPILPVSNIFDESYYTGRYFFHISVFLICILPLLMEYPIIKGRAIYKGAVMFVSFLIIAAFIKQDIHISNSIQQERLMAKEAASVFMDSQKKYVQAEQPSWFYTGLRKINREFFGKDIKTGITPPADLLDYTAPERLKEIRESGADIPYDEILKHQKRFRKGPLTVHMTLDNYRLTWDFGPDKHIVYMVLRGPVSGLYYNQSVLQPTGSVMFGKTNRDGSPDIGYLKIFYHSKEGEEVVSPEFEIRVPGRQKIEYDSK